MENSNLSLEAIKQVMIRVVQDALEHHTEKVIKPFVKSTVKRAVHESKQEILSVLQTLMTEIDHRFNIVESDIKMIKTELVRLDRKIELVR